MSGPTEFRWIPITGFVFGCIYAFGIGANDVANSFGSSVSAKSLTLVQAILAASICELSGSMLLGATVTGTIKNKIIIGSYYDEQPELLMFGMLCSLVIGGIWLLLATGYQYPVSTTHTIVASICGFSFAAFGWKSINWPQLRQVFISWITSPLITGFISFVFFAIVKNVVLKSSNPFDRAIITYPIVVFTGITVNLWFVLYKSNNRIGAGTKFVLRVVTPVALGSGLLCAVLTYCVIGPLLKKKIEKYHEQVQDIQNRLDRTEQAQHENMSLESNPITTNNNIEIGSTDHEESKTKNIALLAWNAFALNTFRQDLQTQAMSESERAAFVWNQAVLYDPKTEHLFSYVQVFTACLTSFAHGANDVANAMAPLSAIINIYNTGTVPTQGEVSYWILAIGGGCIDLGFIFVALASFLGIPISTTQCLVGATVGTGIADGGLKNVEWFFFVRVCIGWVVVFFTAAIGTGLFFGYCVYSPSLAST